MRCPSGPHLQEYIGHTHLDSFPSWYFRWFERLAAFLPLSFIRRLASMSKLFSLENWLIQHLHQARERQGRTQASAAQMGVFTRCWCGFVGNVAQAAGCDYSNQRKLAI